MQFKLENNQLIDVKIVRKPRMKHIYLRINPTGVVVSANRRTPLSDIEKFVFSKSAWILKHLKVQEGERKKRELVTGNEIYFQGKPYVLNCQVKEGLRNVTLEFNEESFHISHSSSTEQELLEEVLNLFYKQEAIRTITPLVKKWSDKMKLNPSNIGFRKAKSRWGSCSSQNSLSFNYYLSKLPLPIVEYVVVHELAHIKEKNHSKNFWALVEEFLPNYRMLVKELREFEKLI
jgi:predicted metal-dependent hydrolase